MLYIRERKTALRAALVGHATNPESETSDVEAAEITARLQRSDLWRRCHTLLCYVPLLDELDSRLLIRSARCAGKRVAVPRVEGSRLDFRLLPDGVRLPDRSARLFQPSRNWPLLHLPSVHLPPRSLRRSLRRPLHLPLPSAAPTPATAALLIVPGLAFDTDGNRLGRGGGYYDRFLATWGSRLVSVALCPSRRLLPALPIEPHDRRVDALISSNYYAWYEDAMRLPATATIPASPNRKAAAGGTG